uniref:liprin-alpha-like n=1 Tax=Fragaria vesca subsp. vesca TaxID=101020 RepID=UPI0005C7F968|nr:PREDICTED: liprin-alpha-like [Fragaria vesca subsp. vesca]
MMMNYLVLFILTLSSILILVILVNSKTFSKNMAVGRLLYSVDILFVRYDHLQASELCDRLYSSIAFKMKEFSQKIRNLESELESKARDIRSAEAKTISVRKQFEELVLERDRLLESSGTRLKQIESELGTKTRDINVAEANATTLKKQLEELLLEYDVLLERNQILENRSESLQRVKELEYELETRTKDVNVAEANNITLRKQFEESLLENDRLSEWNQVLNNQLQSSGKRLQHLESELQTKRNEANAAEAKVVALWKEKQDIDIELQTASSSLRHKEYELKIKTEHVTTTEASNSELRRLYLNLKNQLDSMSTLSEETSSLRNENQSLKKKLQSSSTRLRELESAEDNDALKMEIQSLKDQLQKCVQKIL